ncbi:MAG: AtpZ/AtpI family protein [Terriglobales bacterium]
MVDPRQDPSSLASTLRQVATWVGVALTVPAAALIGFGIGYYLDLYFGTGHVLTIIFVVLGFLAGLIEILRNLPKG